MDLLQNGTVIATTVTDEYGRFQFTNLAPGEYEVRVNAGNEASARYHIIVNADQSVSVYGRALSGAWHWDHEPGEHWEAMSAETRKRWTESYKIVKYPFLLRVAVSVAFLLVVAGLIIYKGWVREGQYKYFQGNPEWLWVFAAFGLLVVVLLVAVIVSYVRRRRRGPVDQSEWPSS